MFGETTRDLRALPDVYRVLAGQQIGARHCEIAYGRDRRRRVEWKRSHGQRRALIRHGPQAVDVGCGPLDDRGGPGGPHEVVVHLAIPVVAHLVVPVCRSILVRLVIYMTSQFESRRSMIALWDRESAVARRGKTRCDALQRHRRRVTFVLGGMSTGRESMARKSFGAADAKGSRKRAGKPQILVYIDPDVATALKRAAIQRDTNVSALVEQACRQFLSHLTKKPER